MKQGFDDRIVEYEFIHNINPKDERALVAAIDPKKRQVILDGMSGYGAVAKNILQKTKDVTVYLLDESSVQIRRALKFLPNLPRRQFKTLSFTNSKFKVGFFDSVVIKMGLHEVPKSQQIKVLKEGFRILKPQGKLIIWDIMLTKDTQKLFQRIIRKKDQLAGYDMLVKERYFFREDEFIKNVKSAGFTKIKDYHKINYRFASLKRLQSELHNDRNKLTTLNNYINKIFPENLKAKLKYKNSKNDVQFTITKKIFVIGK